MRIMDVSERNTAMELLKIEEAARRLQLSESMLRRMTRQHEIDVVRIGRAVRIPADALQQWVDRHREPAREAEPPS